MKDPIERIFESLTPEEQHRLAAQVAGNYRDAATSQSTERVRELEAEVERLKERLRENADKRARINAALAEARKVIELFAGGSLDVSETAIIIGYKKAAAAKIAAGDWLSRNKESSNGK